MAEWRNGDRLKCFEVVGNGGAQSEKGAFFIRKQDAETFGKHVNRDVREAVITDGDTCRYLLGPRHVPDTVAWFLRVGALKQSELSLEDKAALLHAFGPGALMS